ncbi:MAG: hypothetical protein R3D65_11675 [Zhengella sp.]|uniref:hypothetical protein n=1 Tax=Zhengella sp. TaxID=2282762 RepID=UPI001E17C876|nr:hypothetical protein [Notoacmeibacter sp.]MCC0028475.1 glycosyltransferase family 1 protein [Brucellaceae bacterium]
MPHDLVVFGEDWGRHPSSTQHLVSRLAAERKTVWVNSLGLRRPRLSWPDLQRLAAKAARLAAPSRTRSISPAGPGHPFTAMIEPRAIPWPGSRMAAAFNRRQVGAQVRATMTEQGLSAPVLWTSLPTALPLLGTLGERAVIYYAGDDFAALHGVDHGPVLAMELELAERAALVLAASPESARRFDPAKTVILPHGVDFDLFANPVAPAPDMPPGKVAGFYGSLNGWIDVEAIATAARSLPDWTFVLIGRAETDLSALDGLANVRRLAPLPHDDLPAWSQHWTVSLLPFRRNRQIAACNPLKLREYLATGRPVAATWKFPAIDAIAAPVETPAGGETLASAILRAEAGGQRAREFAPRLKGESWDARAAFLAQLIDAL